MRHDEKLSPHPRLYLHGDNLCRERTLPWLKQAESHLKRWSDVYVKSSELTYPRNVHNEHLLRARDVQRRVVTLLARWMECGHERFREAVLRHIKIMGDWECWSWITWRNGNTAPDAIFDLSYGENSATLAIAYDLLYNTLSDAEKKFFLEIARRWSFASGLKHVRKGGTWWFGNPQSNWNTVCTGGLGLLALAMYDDSSEARKLLPRVEQSIRPFINNLEDTDGAWPEGIGYWNYGMRYAFMFLLSHETSFGHAHPLLRLAALRKTLRFPLDFCPNGQPCSFGDVNSWFPIPIHYAMAMRLGLREVTAEIEKIMENTDDIPESTWPDPAEWLFLHPGKRLSKRPSCAFNGIRFYRGLQWGFLADTMPSPKLYLSFRGGTTKVPHGHKDLMSFHCVIGREQLITNLGPSEYLDSTFSSRRDEIFEMGPQSKNTILVNGVGITTGSELDLTEQVSVPGAVGVRFIATSAMGLTFAGKPAVNFCARLILLLRKNCFLVIDRVEMPHAGRVEARVHACASVVLRSNRALIRGRKEQLQIICAANVPAVLCKAMTAPTTPSAPQAAVIRWCTEKLHNEITLAMLLSPGLSSSSLVLEEKSGCLVARVRTRGLQSVINLTSLFCPAGDR